MWTKYDFKQFKAHAGKILHEITGYQEMTGVKGVSRGNSRAGTVANGDKERRSPWNDLGKATVSSQKSISAQVLG